MQKCRKQHNKRSHLFIIKKRYLWLWFFCLFFCLIIHASLYAGHVRAAFVWGCILPWTLWIDSSEIAAFHGGLQFLVSKQLLQLLQVHHVLVVVQCWVVFHCLVVQRDQMLCGIGAIFVELFFVLVDGCKQPVDLEIFHWVAGDLALKKQALLLEFLQDWHALPLQMLHD